MAAQGGCPKCKNPVGNRLATPTRPNKFTQNGDRVECVGVWWQVCLTNFELARPKRNGPDPSLRPAASVSQLQLPTPGDWKQDNLQQACGNFDGDYCVWAPKSKTAMATQLLIRINVLTDTHNYSKLKLKLKLKHEHNNSILMLTSWQCGTFTKKQQQGPERTPDWATSRSWECSWPGIV